MIPQTLATLAEWSGARLIAGDPLAVASSVGSDTRRIEPGSLLVALRGEHYDAHDFVGQAGAAAAVLVSRAVAAPPGVGVLLVEDTLLGLQRLAARYRRHWGGIVVGLTGSNGKTSTKDMIQAVLGERFRVCATRGNLNNHIGLPLSVLSAGAEHSHGVFEMGMNHPGEIAPLAAVAAPEVAVITNIGTAHIEYMGSREAIALEKGSLAEAVAPDGMVVLNANDSFTPAIAARCRAGVLTAGIEAGEVRVTEVRSAGAGCAFTLQLPDHTCGLVRLGVPGRHMAGNAALAAAVGYHLGLRVEEIVAGLERAVLSGGRLQLRLVDGLRFLDDSYNANPDSMRAALETLRTFAAEGRRVAVLGRMGELGATARAAHLALGAAVQELGIDQLCVVGSGDADLIGEGYVAAGGAPAKLRSFSDAAAAAAFLRASAGPGDLILVKGSRSAAMERVIQPFSS